MQQICPVFYVFANAIFLNSRRCILAPKGLGRLHRALRPPVEVHLDTMEEVAAGKYSPLLHGAPVEAVIPDEVAVGAFQQDTPQ